MKELLVKKCPECDGIALTWHCSHDAKNGVVDGRLRMHDISTVFYLGCDYCSETIKIIKGDELASLMSQI